MGRLKYTKDETEGLLERGVKYCSKCNQVHSVKMFNKSTDKNRKDGLVAYCIPCNKKYMKEYGKKTKKTDKVLKYTIDERKGLFERGYVYCSKCNTVKHVSMFLKDKGNTNGIRGKCGSCDSEYKQSERGKTLRNINNQRPEVKASRNLSNSKRYAKEREAYVNLSPNEQARVEEFYITAKLLSKAFDTEYHVDHILPIVPKEGCIGGLHHPDNLQILTSKANQIKSNRSPMFGELLPEALYPPEPFKYDIKLEVEWE